MRFCLLFQVHILECMKMHDLLQHKKGINPALDLV